ncbi:MAG: chemotaxis protein CheW [bacterium]|jgi:purine-binding chemotaxis protein CheW
MSDRQVVIFKISNELYALPIMQVNEIVRMQKVTRVPDAAVFIEGITNLRGNVIPVVDFRKRFNMVAAEADDHTRIIVVTANGQFIGLIVDEVTEVLTIKDDAIEQARDIGFGIDAQYIDGVAKIGEDLVVLIDLERIFSAAEQKNLAKAL